MTKEEFIAQLTLLGWTLVFRGENTESWQKGHSIFQFNILTDVEIDKYVLFSNWYGMQGLNDERAKIICSCFDSSMIEILERE